MKTCNHNSVICHNGGNNSNVKVAGALRSIHTSKKQVRINKSEARKEGEKNPFVWIESEVDVFLLVTSVKHQF